MRRLALFTLADVLAVITIGLEVHVGPSLERVAGTNLAFVEALVVKAMEHIAFAVLGIRLVLYSTADQSMLLLLVRSAVGAEVTVGMWIPPRTTTAADHHRVLGGFGAGGVGVASPVWRENTRSQQADGVAS